MFACFVLLQIVGQFAIYALFRSATLRSAPDKKVFDRLWRTQEKLPMVVLWGKAVWTADMFLVEYAPIPDITVSRLSPKVRKIPACSLCLYVQYL
jgi:hypothetical protein